MKITLQPRSAKFPIFELVTRYGSIKCMLCRDFNPLKEYSGK
jgi:hypothetical protein